MSIKAVIFDLDMTMVDTACLERFRQSRDWAGAYANVGASTYYKGIQEVLDFCSTSGLPIGVVTTSPSKYAVTVLNHHDIKFDELVAYHDVGKGRTKPFPDQLILCAKKLGVSVESCLTVGDLPRDIEAGKGAQMATAAALWGCASPEILLQAGPDHILRSPEELHSLIQTLVE